MAGLPEHDGGQLVGHGNQWCHADVAWPCGHIERLTLTQLPDRLRERRAIWHAVSSQCWSCMDTGGSPPAMATSLRPLRPVGDARVTPGLPVITCPEQVASVLDTALEVEVDLCQQHTPLCSTRSVVIRVVPGSVGTVCQTVEPVQVWGGVHVDVGGRAACAPGGAAWLLGGAAAAGDRGRLIASSGRGIAGPGAQVSVETLPGETLDLWLLPGVQIAGGGIDVTVVSSPTRLIGGKLVAIAGGEVPIDLVELLELAESLPVRRMDP